MQTYADIGAYYDRARSADPVGLPIEAVRYVLSDTDYMNKHGRVVALQDELARLQGDVAALGSFAETASFALESDLATATIEAGLRASRLIDDFRVEVQDWDIKARELEIEITTTRIMMEQEIIDEGGSVGVEPLRARTRLAGLALRGRVLGGRGGQLPRSPHDLPE